METAFRVIPLPVSAEKAGHLPRASVAGVPVSVIRAICARPELLKLPGQSVLEPSGVLSGMVFAAITPAAYAALSSCFQSISRSRDCCGVLSRRIHPRRC